MTPAQCWGALWHSENQLNGVTEHLLYDRGIVALFPNRATCRRWISETYGYIANRPDLQQEPHGWRVPRAVRVTVQVEREGK